MGKKNQNHITKLLLEPKRKLRKTQIPKTFANVNKFVRLGGKKGSRHRVTRGGKLPDRAAGRRGVRSPSEGPDPGAGCGKPPLSGAQRRGRCASATQQKPQQGDTVQGPGASGQPETIPHVRPHAHALTGVRAKSPQLHPRRTSGTDPQRPRPGVL